MLRKLFNKLHLKAGDLYENVDIIYSIVTGRMTWGNILEHFIPGIVTARVFKQLRSVWPVTIKLPTEVYERKKNISHEKQVCLVKMQTSKPGKLLRFAVSGLY